MMIWKGMFLTSLNQVYVVLVFLELQTCTLSPFHFCCVLWLANFGSSWHLRIDVCVWTCNFQTLYRTLPISIIYAHIPIFLVCVSLTASQTKCLQHTWRIRPITY